MKCLILAAGRGSRLQLRGNSKPLVPIFGVPLIERVIRAAMEARVDEFFVVSGHEKVLVHAFLKDLAGRFQISLTPVFNDEWRKENGISVLKAREFLREPFLLLMADHIIDPLAISEVLEVPLPLGEVNLAVDHNLNNPNVNLSDVTRIKRKGGKVIDAGKNLTDYNGFDTGMFLCTPAIFGAVVKSVEKYDDTTLSGAVRVLAREGKVNATPFRGQFWVDVDDPHALRKAENILLENISDGFNRP